MDAMVTARVPVEIKEQGAAILKEMGSSITELVNAAFSYLLAERKLPGLKGSATASGKNLRTLSPEQRREFLALIAGCALANPSSGWDGRDWREIAAEERARDYEALG